MVETIALQDYVENDLPDAEAFWSFAEFFTERHLESSFFETFGQRMSRLGSTHQDTQRRTQQAMRPMAQPTPIMLEPELIQKRRI